MDDDFGIFKTTQQTYYYHSVLQYSEDIHGFLANFFKRIVKKGGQKLILGDNFINKNWNIKNWEKPPFWLFFAIFDGPIKKCHNSKVVVHKNRHYTCL